MDSIKLKTVFGKNIVALTLKVLSIAEENRLRQRGFGLSENEREEKGYELAVSALTEFATEDGEIISFDENGKEVIERVSVAEYFKNKDAAKERIAHYAFHSWLVALQPDVSFS